MSSTPSDADEPTRLFDRRVRAATFTILTLVALSAFEGLAVVAALPDIAGDLGHVELLPWSVTTYLLLSGVATVAAGALVDRLGVAPVFRGAVGLFVFGSAVSGLAPDMLTLIAGRSLQGVGAGAINAVGLSAGGLVYPRKLVARAYAANSNVWGLMSVAGPALAAALLTFASWRWIFLVNLPLGGLALAVGWRALPGRREGAGQLRLPALDLALLTGFSLLALLTIDALSWRSAVTGAGALVVGAWLIRRNRGRADALIAPRHALDAPLGPLSWGTAAILVGGIGTQTFVPLFVNGGRGVSIALTAWSVIFFVLGWTSGANLSSRLMARWPVDAIVKRGGTLVPLALFGVATTVLLDGPLAAIFALLYLTGLGTGSASHAGLTLVRELVDDDELGRAVAAHQFVRNLGFALGNALVGAVLLFVVGHVTGDVEQLRGAVGEGGQPAALGADVAAAIELGFGLGVLAAATVAVLGVVLLFRLRKPGHG